MVEHAAPGAMPRPIERRAIDDPGAGMLARPDAGLDVGSRSARKKPAARGEVTMPGAGAWASEPKATGEGHGLEEVQLVTVWNGKHTNDDPWIERPTVVFLGRAKEEMQIGVTERIAVFQAHLC